MTELGKPQLTNDARVAETSKMEQIINNITNLNNDYSELIEKLSISLNKMDTLKIEINDKYGESGKSGKESVPSHIDALNMQLIKLRKSFNKLEELVMHSESLF